MNNTVKQITNLLQSSMIFRGDSIFKMILSTLAFSFIEPLYNYIIEFIKSIINKYNSDIGIIEMTGRYVITTKSGKDTGVTKSSEVITLINKILVEDKNGPNIVFDSDSGTQKIANLIHFQNMNDQYKLPEIYEDKLDFDHKIDAVLSISFTEVDNELNYRHDYVYRVKSKTMTNNELRIYFDKVNKYYQLKTPKCIKRQIKQGIEYKFTFSTTKDFGNMFFDEKDLLIRRIDRLNNINEYNRLGIPRTLGILLHGEPGTGKTSIIKAIANYTNRNITVISDNFRTVDELRALFNDYANDIIVFEEIDCSNHKNMILNRLTNDREDNNEDINKNNVNLNFDKTDEYEKYLENRNSDITMGQFLELLDGIEEMPGRIIIMTTNRIDVIDNAITRPGRIDLVIETKPLRREYINEMYNLWFGEYIPDDVYENVPDLTITMAVCGQIFATEDMELIHKLLVTYTKDTIIPAIRL